MSTATLYRWAGIAGIVAGVLVIIVNFVPGGIWGSLGRPLNLLVPLLSMWALAAVYLWQRQASGLLGFIGYIVNSLGLALLVGNDFTIAFIFPSLDAAVVGGLLAGTTRTAFMVGLDIFVVGVILFGVATIRAGVFSKWAAGLYIVGWLVAAVIFFIPQIIVSIGEVIGSIGFIWLSYALWSGAGETTEQAVFGT
jgi:hypothetical protein